MSFYGILLLISLILIGILPEVITLGILYNIQCKRKSRYVKASIFLLLFIVSSGFNFLVYSLFHYRNFHSWNLVETALNIGKGNIFYQNFTYFSKSILLCMTAAIIIGIVLRQLLKKFFGGGYTFKTASLFIAKQQSYC